MGASFSQRRHWPRFVSRWHGRIGLVGILFVLLLSGTGILIHHGDALGLGRRYVTAGWLLDWYGMEVPPMRSYTADAHTLTQVGERIYFDERLVCERCPELLGAVALDGIWIGALSGQLYLLTAEGELIERLGQEHGLPAGVRAIGVAERQLLVRANRGCYGSDGDYATWRPVDEAAPATWSRRGETPDALRERLAMRYRGPGLSWERLLLDLHSGRIVGEWGGWLVDAVALGFTLLAVSGLWMWWHRRPSHPAVDPKALRDKRQGL